MTVISLLLRGRLQVSVCTAGAQRRQKLSKREREQIHLFIAECSRLWTQSTAHSAGGAAV